MRAFSAMAAGLLLLGGCADSDSFLSGKWATDDPVPVGLLGEDLAALGFAQDAMVYVELSLGHYGQDVAGVIRLWTDETRRTPLCEAPEEIETACTWVRKGLYIDDSEMFLFSVGFLNQNDLTDVALRTSADQLTWTIDDNTSVVFNRVASEERLSDRDKSCTSCFED